MDGALGKVHLLVQAVGGELTERSRCARCHKPLGTRYGVPLSDMTLSKLVKELGFDADVHGFRTSFRTWVQEQTDYPREVAEAALAHAVGDAVEQAYARSDMLDRRRQMMDAWAEYLSHGRRDG